MKTKKEESSNPQTVENKPAEGAEAKQAYVPKFKMKPKVETIESKPEEDVPNVSPENIEPKPAYKTRFNMKNVPPKPPEE